MNMQTQLFNIGDKVRIIVDSEDSVLCASFDKGSEGVITKVDLDNDGTYSYDISCLEYDYCQWYVQDELELI